MNCIKHISELFTFSRDRKKRESVCVSGEEDDESLMNSPLKPKPEGDSEFPVAFASPVGLFVSKLLSFREVFAFCVGARCSNSILCSRRSKRFWSWGWFGARSYRNWDHRSVPSAPRVWIISWIVRILWNVKLNCLSLSWIVKLFSVVSSLSTTCFHFWLVTVRLQRVCGIPSRQRRFSELIPREKQFSREFIRRACCCSRERRGRVFHLRRFRDESAFVSSRRSDKEFRQFGLQHPAYASAAEILVRLCRILQNFWVRRDKSDLFFDYGAPTAPSIWRRRYLKSTNMDNYENWKPPLFFFFFFWH